jgi:DUF971 family protein
MSQIVPTSIARRETEPGLPSMIEIAWSDGTTASYTPRLLRDACPCATCRERRAAPAPASLLQVLAPEETLPLAVTGMRPVGQYAYSIEFSDGHDSGIYTLDYLRELAEVDRSEP